jgi:peptidoglycan/xylan/chitin deacetylase (PgdA/CDA1 family)
MMVETIAGLATAAGVMAYGVRGKSSRMFGPSVYRGMGDRPSIALTFDDGPSELTPQVLEVLAEHDVKATFFQCGFHVRRLPRVARMVADAGHEIGNHSDTHPRFDFKSRQFIHRELSAAQRSIEDATGFRPQLFRAPYGVRWFGFEPVQRELNLLGVMWTIIGRDWKWNAGRIGRLIMSHVNPGAIICLHDGRELALNPDIGPTIEALQLVIPMLKDAGYGFERVSEIIQPARRVMPATSHPDQRIS